MVPNVPRTPPFTADEPSAIVENCDPLTPGETSILYAAKLGMDAEPTIATFPRTTEPPAGLLIETDAPPLGARFGGSTTVGWPLGASIGSPGRGVPVARGLAVVVMVGLAFGSGVGVRNGIAHSAHSVGGFGRDFS